MAFPTMDESRHPMLSKQQPGNAEEYYFEDDQSDVTTVSLTAEARGKPAETRKRSPSDSSWWSAHDITSSKKRQARRLVVILTWTRWGVVVVLQSIIIMIMLWRNIRGGGETDSALKGKTVETGGDINGLYKTRKNPQLPEVMKQSST
jgi:hypothetical protein